jgi:cell division septation protein DedD
MAPGKRKKKGFTVSFDLSLAGLGGVGVVCFCIFFWMFLLGVWAGQTVLSAGQDQIYGAKNSQVKTLQTGAKRSVPLTEKDVAPTAAKAVSAPGFKKKGLVGKTKENVPPKNKVAFDTEEDPAFFAVQVAAFKDGALAVKEVESWKNKGYSAFFRTSEGKDDKFTRVYVGHFDSMAAAKEKAGAIGEEGKIKPFIVLVPEE